MADVNQSHVTNLVAKTNRWTAALDAAGALAVPDHLIALERSCPAGKLLADANWDQLTAMVAKFHGKPLTGKGAETRPESTRKAIAASCADLIAFRAMPKRDLMGALAGLPS